MHIDIHWLLELNVRKRQKLSRKHRNKNRSCKFRMMIRWRRKRRRRRREGEDKNVYFSFFDSVLKNTVIFSKFLFCRNLAKKSPVWQMFMEHRMIRAKLKKRKGQRLERSRWGELGWLISGWDGEGGGRDGEQIKTSVLIQRGSGRQLVWRRHARAHDGHKITRRAGSLFNTGGTSLIWGDRRAEGVALLWNGGRESGRVVETGS